ncbi:unnamed protein product, partial [Oppiella nova]
MRNKGKRKTTPASAANQLAKSMAELSFKDNRRRLLLVDELLKKCTYYNNNTTNCHQLMDEHKDIDGLVDEIMAIEREISVELPKRSADDWLTFKRWLSDDNGVDISKVDVQWMDDRQGYGLTAIADIKESDVFLVIPRKVMITCETALNSDRNL